MQKGYVHVVYLVSTLGRSGPTQQLLNLIRYLDPQTFRVSIVTLSREPTQTLKAVFLNLKVSHYCLESSTIFNYFFLKRRLRCLLSSIRPDIVHSQGFRADILSSMLGCIWPRIATQRNDPFEDYPALYGFAKGKIIAKLHISALRRIPRVVTCSETLSKKNLEYRLNSQFIRNGVEFSEPSTALRSNKLSSIFESLQFSPDKEVFIYAGPLVSRKQPDLLVRTFLSPTAKEKILIMLGDGPLIDLCQQLAGTSPNIFIPGHVENVREYFLVANCFISASVSEGLPNAVLESLADGIPAILSDIPAHRELQQLAPKAITLFSPVTQSKLLEKVISFSQSQDVGKRSDPAIERLLSAKRMSNEYQLMYKTLRSGL